MENGKKVMSLQPPRLTLPPKHLLMELEEFSPGFIKRWIGLSAPPPSEKAKKNLPAMLFSPQNYPEPYALVFHRHRKTGEVLNYEFVDYDEGVNRAEQIKAALQGVGNKN